jgi:hypothetical protein
MSSIFSEGRGVIGDALLNGTGVEDARIGVREEISENYVGGGLLLTLDCPYCSLQWKSIVKWVEFQQFYLGEKVPNTQATQAGVCIAYGCKKCNHVTPVLVSWVDIERHVNHAMKVRALSPDLPRARAQIIAERAAKQAKQR